jgi:secreted PhoX family phosphatase
MNNGKNPNSFVYRFVPENPTDLTHGKLQALQVSINGSPVVFVPVDINHPNGDTRSQNQLSLHTVGASWPVQWVTVHDTAVNGTAPFDANALAKAAGATPFKRPENGQFQPGSHFRTFFFLITGDTDIPRAQTLCWQRAERGVESSVWISTQAMILATSLWSSWATPTMLRLIISRS